MYKKHNPISPICHKTNIRVENQLSPSKFSQVKVWDPTGTYLRSKGHMRSKFQNGKFENLIADSESLQKSVK